MNSSHIQTGPARNLHDADYLANFAVFYRQLFNSPVYGYGAAGNMN